MYIQSAKKIQTKTNKVYLEIFDSQNQKYSCWDEEDFMKFIPGAEVEVEVIVKGNYKNIRIAGKPYTPRPSGIAQAQVRKAEYIEQAQERKDASIAFFNANNSAIQLLAVYKELTPIEEAEEFIRKWRNWFMREWQNKPPFV